MVTFIVTGLLSVWRRPPVYNEVTKCNSRELEGTKAACNEWKEANKSVCPRNEFSDIVLVIVYNFPYYSSIPALTSLYKNAFPTIMFCGPEKAEIEIVEVLPI